MGAGIVVQKAHMWYDNKQGETGEVHVSCKSGEGTNKLY
jgi:hypothetical protein